VPSEVTGTGPKGKQMYEWPSKSCDLSNLTWVVSRYHEVLALP